MMRKPRRSSLIEKFRGLIISKAKKFYRFNRDPAFDIEDYIQEAYVIMYSIYRNVDTNLDYKFSTYLSMNMEQEIIKYYTRSKCLLRRREIIEGEEIDFDNITTYDSQLDIIDLINRIENAPDALKKLLYDILKGDGYAKLLPSNIKILRELKCIIEGR